MLDHRTKGLPFSAHAIALDQIGAQNWNLLKQDLPFPVAVLRESALKNNGRWMREFVTRTGAKLAPHGKTTMSPQLFRMQIDDGAWGITLSTIHHVRVARAAGIQRILLANELIGAQDIAWIAAEVRAHPELEFYCLVDSVEGVKRLGDAPLNVLLEIGYAGGRAGCRDSESALAVARAVKASPALKLRGVEGFEGLYQSLPAAEGLAKVRAFLDSIIVVAQRADAENLFSGDDIILSAGGSSYYDVVADAFRPAKLSRPVSIVLRSGCYFSHDAGFYEHKFSQVRERDATARAVAGRFENALEVWAQVLSVPEPQRAILGAGRRDFGHDSGAPSPIKLFRPSRDTMPVAMPQGCEIVGINDQHAHVKLAPGADVKIGDLVALGVSHPCTTFDRWQLIYPVDDAYTARSAVQTFF